MTSKSRDRPAGLVPVALLIALAGELLGVLLLVKTAVPTLFLAAASLLALIAVNTI
ncbi:hypothetical protein [Halorubrum ezzemoulense]|nr:hypothetical protein [Halorubrum ezzemoulense]